MIGKCTNETCDWNGTLIYLSDSGLCPNCMRLLELESKKECTEN